MVSARSTVSMARTTPAQKPRGEQSTIFRGGLADMGRPRTESAPLARRVVERSIQRDNTSKDLGRLSGAVKGTHCARGPGRLIRGAIPVIVDDHGFASRRWAKRKGDLP